MIKRPVLIPEEAAAFDTLLEKHGANAFTATDAKQLRVSRYKLEVLAIKGHIKKILAYRIRHAHAYPGPDVVNDLPRYRHDYGLHDQSDP